jgi:hypothetical protein
MRKATLIVTALAMLTASVFARIGETKEQLQDRYGYGTAFRGFTHYHFLQFRIGVKFDDDGRCGLEGYSKEDKSSITDGELQALLDANSDGTPWVKIIDTSYQKLYRSQHREATLTYDGYLMIADSEALKRIDAPEKQQDVTKLRGF